MEARYVHTPAVAPEARQQEPAEASTEEQEPLMQEMTRHVEDSIRAHPGLYVVAGLAFGFLIGIVARR